MTDTIDIDIGDPATFPITPSDLAAESSRAQAAEGLLQDNIDAEETRATGAEAGLQSAIDTEETRATDAEAALLAEVAGKQPLDTDLTAFAGLSPANNDIVQRKSGAWTNRTPAQFKTDLALAKGDVGLGNVDNTSDLNKPISTATQTALTSEQSARTAADTAEQTARVAADAAEQSGRINADTALSDRIDPYEASIATPAVTPAEARIDLDAGYPAQLDGQLRIDERGVWLGNRAHSPGPSHLERADVITVDRLGRVISVLSTSGVMTDGTSDYTREELLARSNRAVQLAVQYAGATVDTLTAWPWNYCHFLVYGQSFSNGTNGHPALTKTGASGVLMLGDAVRPSGGDATSYTPVGSSTLNPFEGTVQDPNTGAILDDAAIAALADTDHLLGEELGGASVNWLRRMWLHRHDLAADTTRQWVVSSCGRGDKSVEELSKGAAQPIYNRLTSAAAQVKAIADGEGKTYGVAAILYNGNQNNYLGSRGATTDRVPYKDLLRQLFEDMTADLAVGGGSVAQQDDPPAVAFFATGGPYTIEDTELSIARAQLELSEEDERYVLVGPEYPITHSGSHPDSNGHRMLALQAAKALAWQAINRRRWRPLRPTAVTYRGATVAVDWHVPCPPLQWRPSFSGRTPTWLDNRGFRIFDALGEVEVADVEIVGDAVTEHRCARALVAPVYFYSALDNGVGITNLCDSDPTVPPYDFEYLPDEGMPAEENVAELVGKPYPMWNWAVPDKWEATASDTEPLATSFGDALSTGSGDTIILE